MIFCCEGFCPNKKSTVSYVYHCSKVSYRSSFVFGGDVVPGDFVPGGFCPSNKSTLFYVLQYSYHSYRATYVFGGFCPRREGGILSPEGLSSLL